MLGLLPSAPSHHQLLMQHVAGAFSLYLFFVFCFFFLNNTAQISFSKVFKGSCVDVSQGCLAALHTGWFLQMLPS